jgi:hypothetical protein
MDLGSLDVIRPTSVLGPMFRSLAVASMIKPAGQRRHLD